MQKIIDEMRLINFLDNHQVSQLNLGQKIGLKLMMMHVRHIRKIVKLNLKPKC